MSRFFRRVALLIFISVMCVLTIRVIGGVTSKTPLTIVMSGPDGVACDRPCLFGVLPGETNFEQAKQILHSHPLTRDAKWLDGYTLQLAGPEAYIALSITTDGLVDSIVLTDNLTDTGVAIPESLADSVSLGELIMAYGLPYVVLPGSDYFVVEFPETGITAASARPYDRTTYVQPGTPLSMVLVYAVRPCPKYASIYNIHVWIGFTSVQRYFADPRTHRVSERPSGVPIPPGANCQDNRSDTP